MIPEKDRIHSPKEWEFRARMQGVLENSSKSKQRHVQSFAEFCFEINCGRVQET